MNILNKINAKKVKFLIKSKNNNLLKVHHGIHGWHGKEQATPFPIPLCGKRPQRFPLGGNGKGGGWVKVS
jgi:hypothetical protein